MISLTDNDRVTGPLSPPDGARELATDFPVFDASDLVVLKRTAGGDWQGLQAGDDYMIANLGQDAGATVILTHPAVSGEEYMLVGSMIPEPALRLVYERRVPSDGVNREFDRLWAAIQELRQASGMRDAPGARPVLMPPGEAAVMLPARENRAGCILEFDGDGQPVARFGIDELGNIDTLRWRGAWAQDARYDVADVVEHGGSAYVSRMSHLSSADNAPPDGSAWELLARASTPDGSITPAKIDPDGDFNFRSVSVPTPPQVGDGSVDLRQHGSMIDHVVLNAGRAFLKRIAQTKGRIVFLATGQSNMVGSNKDLDVPDYCLRTDPDVKIWARKYDDNGTPYWEWEVSEPGRWYMDPAPQDPDNMEYPKAANIAHALGLRLREEFGVPVYIVMQAVGSTSVVNWSGLHSAGDPMYKWDVGGVLLALANNARRDLNARGIEGRPDFLIWHQGEQDTAQNLYNAGYIAGPNQAEADAWYAQEFIAFLRRFDDYRYVIPYGMPVIVGGLMEKGLYSDRNSFFYSIGRFNIHDVALADSTGFVDDGIPEGPVHFRGEDLYRFGYERYFNALLAIIGSGIPLEMKTPYWLGGTVDMYGYRPPTLNALKELLLPTTNGGLRASGVITSQVGHVGQRAIFGLAQPDGGVLPNTATGVVVLAGADVTLPDAATRGCMITVVSDTFDPVTVWPPQDGTINYTAEGVVLPGKHSTITLACHDHNARAWRVLALTTNDQIRRQAR